ncbi:type II toxin-antitoxin system VapB family antitoxin [Leptolyngbya sp. NIES-2104]|uniref:type II toxin-antitoxin system VapB family antitoxin n=1 Tax=Leptolyngbya sp. NIES-2104 TaxID=1552121 RepID=UPI0006EC6A75|nr:DUF2281 domain-containing protein [Leptolyngbya sp. NIES-2104]GAP98326.1 hypothetical protein NIES2104_48810 [Leptolyngbya sp. NIES-2104]
MLKTEILERLEKLPESLQQEIIHYIEFLSDRYAEKTDEAIAPQKKRKAGLLKGKIIMSDDFDAPPEDMKDYM